MFQNTETKNDTISWAAMKNPALLNPMSMSHCHEDKR